MRSPRVGLTIGLAAAMVLACSPRDNEQPRRGETPSASTSGGKSAVPPTPEPRVLRRSLSTPQALEPARVGDVGGATVIADLFEGLYRIGPGGQPALAAAGQHATSADGLTHTFTLRSSARWSDGQRVTAADFVRGWLRALDPEMAGSGAAALYSVVGARAYNGSIKGPERARLRDVVGVRAQDERTLVVRLEWPDPHFGWALTRPATVPVHRAAGEGGEPLIEPGAISNGPWVLVEHVTGQRIVAQRNPHYDDGTAIPFDRIEYTILEDETAAHNLYVTDKLDYIAGKVPGAVLATLRREGSRELRVVPFAGIDFYLFNVTRAPFDDVRVRRALSLAIDRAAIGERVLKGGELEAVSLLPPGLGGAERDGFDPKRARALLAEAGFGPATPLRRIALSHDQSEPARRLAEYAQQQWMKNLGVDCDLVPMERKALIGRQMALDYDLSRAAWFADVPDGAEFLEPWRGGTRANRTGWTSPAFDTALDAVMALTDPAARSKAVSAAETILMNAVPAIPTFVHVRSDLVKPHLLGHDPTTGMYHPSRLFRLAD